MVLSLTLSMARDPHLSAHIEHWAGRAFGADARADVLAEGDEQAVDRHPVAFGQLRLKGQHRLLRGLSLDVAQAIDYAVDVDIDANHRFAAGDPEREMGALRPDPGERLQHLVVAG